MSLVKLEKTTVIYARPLGWHYHLSRDCPMLDNGDFTKLGYVQVTKNTVERRHLYPCICCYEDFDPKRWTRGTKRGIR